MKKRLLLLLMACSLVIGTAWAESITLQHAKTIAGDFMATHAKNAGTMKLSRMAPHPKASSAMHKASYFVFNSERTDGGFVIVAGDDRVPLVLGYSDKGSFNEEEIPSALQELLDSYAAQIGALDDMSMLILNDTPRDPIPPLMTTEWGPQTPYNFKLPLVGSTHVMPGGSSVAMAQVMNYFKWPARPTKTIPSYETSTLKLNMPALPAINFDWDYMQNCYMKNDTTSVGADAVATLVQYCAQSQQLDFKTGSTNSHIAWIPLALSTYFAYQPSAHAIYRVNYSTNEWENIIYNELAEQRPVIYCGSKDNSSLIFVCDGCDNQGMFHINWCLSGQNNGYYRLNVMNIDLLGTGSTSWPSGMVKNQIAVVGLEPGTNQPSVTELTSSEVMLNSYVCTRPAYAGFFKADVTGQFFNFTSRVLTVDYGWGLYEGDNEIINIKGGGGYVTNMKPGTSLTKTNFNLEFGYMIPDGNYTIRQMYSERNANNWHPCVGAEKNFLDVVIRGDSCFITPHGNASDPDFTVNNITTLGNMHPNRPVDITLTMTNNGESVYETLYMSVNGTKKGMGIVSADQGDSTFVSFRYMPTAAGDYTLTFSFNENGSDPIATHILHIDPMPSAKLTATVQPLNVTDVTNSIITDDKFALSMVVTNTGTNPYKEDISVALLKPYDSSPLQTHAINRYVELEVGQTDTLLFELDGVVNGWQYSARAYYYSNGNKVTLKSTGTYTIQYPNQMAVTTDIEPAEGGDLTIQSGVSDGYAMPGNPILFTVTPQDGYVLSELFVISEDGDTIPFTENDGVYRFIMPPSAVTIHVAFKILHSVNLAEEAQLGGVSAVSIDSASEGEPVMISTSPNVGWALQNVIVICGEDTVPVSAGDGGAYVFTMPNNDVSVTVNYVRSTEDIFELVTDINDITADGIYLLANRQYDRVMKYHQKSERTFYGTQAGHWIDEDKTLLKVSELACMFTADNMSIQSIVVDDVQQPILMADLNTGNGYLMGSTNEVSLVDEVSRRHAFISFEDDANNCLLRFADRLLLVPESSPMSYNYGYNQFVISDAFEPIFLYKLAATYVVNVATVEGGTVTVTSATMSDGTVQHGSEVTFIVEPDEGYDLASVSVTTATGEIIEVALNENTGVYSFIMPGSDVTITADFEVSAPSYVVNIAEVEGGTVTITSATLPDGTVQYGREVTFTVEPDEGYNLMDVTVVSATEDTILVVLDEDTGVYSFVMPDCDVTITAVFEVKPAPAFIRGDVNGDGFVTMDDLTALINYLLNTSSPIVYVNAAACSSIDDENVTMDDLTSLINYLLCRTW